MLPRRIITLCRSAFKPFGYIAIESSATVMYQCKTLEYKVYNTQWYTYNNINNQSRDTQKYVSIYTQIHSVKYKHKQVHLLFVVLVILFSKYWLTSDTSWLKGLSF